MFSVLFSRCFFYVDHHLIWWFHRRQRTSVKHANHLVLLWINRNRFAGFQTICNIPPKKKHRMKNETQKKNIKNNGEELMAYVITLDWLMTYNRLPFVFMRPVSSFSFFLVWAADCIAFRTTNHRSHFEYIDLVFFLLLSVHWKTCYRDIDKERVIIGIVKEISMTIFFELNTKKKPNEYVLWCDRIFVWENIVEWCLFVLFFVWIVVDAFAKMIESNRNGSEIV